VTRGSGHKRPLALALRASLAAIGASLALGGMATYAWSPTGDFDLFLSVLQLIFAAVASGPFVIYFVLVRNLFWVIAGGVALSLATVVMYLPIFSSSSSTAGIGFFASIMLNYAIALLAADLDRRSFLADNRNKAPTRRPFSRPP
jgi:hypothetical protein